MAGRVRVAHFLNQFFAGIGGEDRANVPVQVLPGPVGPGLLLQRLLADRGEVVGTISAGDNYFAERPDEAVPQALAALGDLRPDVLVVGPAFDAGRYGLACAALGTAAVRELHLPVVAGMYPENPGVAIGRHDMYIVPTGNSAAGLAQALEGMAELALRLGRGEEIRPAAQSGYLPRGYRRSVVHDRPAAERAVAMLVERLAGRSFQTEIPVLAYDHVVPLPPVRDLRGTKLGLVTSGGIVPRGNPDHQVSGGARQGFRYSIEGLDTLEVSGWESVHGGFSTVVLNTRNPNYALPVSIVRELEREGVIGGVYPYFYSTVGNGTTVSAAKRIAREIAAEFRANGVGAVLLVAT